MKRKRVFFSGLLLALVLPLSSHVLPKKVEATLPPVLSTKSAPIDLEVLRSEVAALRFLRSIVVKDLLVDTVAVAGNYGLVAWEGIARLKPKDPNSGTWPCTGLAYLLKKDNRWTVVDYVYYPVHPQDIAEKIGFPVDVLISLYNTWNPLWKLYFHQDDPSEASQIQPVSPEESERLDQEYKAKVKAEQEYREQLRRQLRIE